VGGALDPDRIKDLFAEFGPVTVRRMFSGAGIFAEGLMIAIVVDGAIFLKADDRTIPQFEREGLKPFSYRTRHGERSIHSFWRIPDRLYDDPEELSKWANEAMGAARRGDARQSGKAAGKRRAGRQRR
jgi:DNA transformation protein